MILISTMITVPLVDLVDPPSRAKKSAEELAVFEAMMEERSAAAAAKKEAAAAAKAAKAAVKAGGLGAGAGGAGGAPPLALLPEGTPHAGDGDPFAVLTPDTATDAAGAAGAALVEEVFDGQAGGYVDRLDDAGGAPPGKSGGEGVPGSGAFGSDRDGLRLRHRRARGGSATSANSAARGGEMDSEDGKWGGEEGGEGEGEGEEEEEEGGSSGRESAGAG
jgi:hypothetical protein